MRKVVTAARGYGEAALKWYRQAHEVVASIARRDYPEQVRIRDLTPHTHLSLTEALGGL